MRHHTSERGGGPRPRPAWSSPYCMNDVMSVSRPEWEEIKAPKKVEVYLSQQGQDEVRVVVTGVAQPGIRSKRVVENLRVRVKRIKAEALVQGQHKGRAVRFRGFPPARIISWAGLVENLSSDKFLKIII